MASDNPDELKVWVDGYQRCICGITETTTVQEVVIALAQAVGQTGRYTLVEKWRSTERLLPPAECPLALLQKWGHYKKDIQFILRRSEGKSNSSAQGQAPQNNHSPRNNNLNNNNNFQSDSHHMQRNNSSLTQAQLDQQLQSRLNRNLPNNQSLPKHYKNHNLMLANTSGGANQMINNDLMNRIGARKHENNQKHSNTLPIPNRGMHNSGNSMNHNLSGTLNNKNQISNINNTPTYEQHVSKIQADIEQHARNEYKKTIIKQEQSLGDIDNEINKFNNEIARLTASIATTVGKMQIDKSVGNNNLSSIHQRASSLPNASNSSNTNNTHSPGQNSLNQSQQGLTLGPTQTFQEKLKKISNLEQAIKDNAKYLNSVSYQDPSILLQKLNNEIKTTNSNTRSLVMESGRILTELDRLKVKTGDVNRDVSRYLNNLGESEKVFEMSLREVERLDGNRRGMTGMVDDLNREIRQLRGIFKKYYDDLLCN